MRQGRHLQSGLRERLARLAGAGLISLAVQPAWGFLVESPLHAQEVRQETAGESGPVRLRAGDVELKSSRVYVFVGKTGFGHEHAIEGMVRSGAVRLGAEQDAGKLEFELRSFQADTARARRYIGLSGSTDAATARKVTANMLGPDVLDTGRFPTATFEIQSVRPHRSQQPPAAGQEYLLEGEFTLHGVKQPLKFVAVAQSVKGWTRLTGRFAIRQTDFGIRPYTAALGAVGITDELTVYGDLWIVPEPAGATGGQPAQQSAGSRTGREES